MGVVSLVYYLHCALEACSQRCAIQIHVYFTYLLTYLLTYLPAAVAAAVVVVAAAAATTTATATTTTTNVMNYSAAITQLQGHFTKSRSKTVAQLNADVCWPSE